MGVVIHGVDTPLITLALMMDMTNSVQSRVSHIQIGRCHIYFGTQYIRPIVKLTGPHALKQFQVFFDGTIAIRAIVAGFSQCAAVFPDLIRGGTIDVCGPVSLTMRSQKLRMDRGVNPARLSPAIVGMRGSSQLLTWPSLTN